MDKQDDKALYQQIVFSDEGLGVVNTQLGIEANIRELAAQGHYHDAVLLLAHALPKREAIWWGCKSIRTTLAQETPDEEQKAIDLAEDWAMKPGDDKRKQVAAMGEAIGSSKASGLLAMATGWSAGSLVSEQNLEVPPPPHLSAVGVAGAVSLAAAAQPANMKASYEGFLKEGLTIITAQAG